MDIRCHRCGEPWEVDYFHDVAEEQGRTFQAVQRDFRSRGCEALGTRRCESNYHNGAAIAVLGEMLGDDIDGLAAMIEDFGL